MNKLHIYLHTNWRDLETKMLGEKSKMQNNICLAKKWQMSSVEDLLCDFFTFLTRKIKLGPASDLKESSVHGIHSCHPGQALEDRLRQSCGLRRGRGHIMLSEYGRLCSNRDIRSWTWR